MTDESQAYRNIKEQYEALGRFVEAFEAMVQEARMTCIQLLQYDTKHPGKHPPLLNVPFYNQALSAKPLYEIMRTLIAEILRDPQICRENEITEEDRETFMGVLRTIASEYTSLCERRNHLLHGTWFIPDPFSRDASEFYVHRLASTKTGLSNLWLEKNSSELLALAGRCERTRIWINLIHSCLAFHSTMSLFASGFRIKVSDVFKSQGGKWFALYNGQLQALREIPPEGQT